MKIRKAVLNDAPIIHQLMIAAFSRYKNDKFPSSALKESVESIRDALQSGEQALIFYLDVVAVGMVRFSVKESGLYFYRLSVLPNHQGKGIAKQLLRALEQYAKKVGL